VSVSSGPAERIADDAPPRRRTGIRRAAPVVKLAVSAALLGWLYTRTDVGELRHHLASADLRVLALVYVLLFANTTISAFKWQLLLRADGIDVRLGSLVASYLIGTFFNIFMPSNIGGDVYRVYDVTRQSARPAGSFASVFADRLTGFVALVALGVIFATLTLQRFATVDVLVVPLAVCVALGTLIWLLLERTLLMRILRAVGLARLPRVMHHAETFLASIHVYWRAPGLLIRAMLLALGFQGLAIVSIWLMSVALGLRIPLVTFCAFVPLISLLEALPISVFGIGVRDVSYVVLFARVGVPSADALSIAVFYVLVTVAYAALGGVVLLVRQAVHGR